MCLDTACVSKATNWWESPIVSIWGESTYPVRGPIVGIVGKGADKVYYDNSVCRHSIYREIFEEGHSSGRVGENQRDMTHSRAEAKSDALCNGGTYVGVRSLIFPPTLLPLTPNFATRLAECRPPCRIPPYSPIECFQMFMHDFIHGCINVVRLTPRYTFPPFSPTPPVT